MNSISSIRARVLSMSDEDYAIYEVPRAVLPGAEKVLQPDVAVITAIAEAHMESFGSLERTAETKATLLRGLSRNGTAIINLDAPYSRMLTEVASQQTRKVITYGSGPEADIQLTSYNAHRREIEASFAEATYRFQLGASGRHNAVNSLSVIGVLEALNKPIDEYLTSLKDFTAVKGRGDIHNVNLEGQAITLIDQTFNANPASMTAAMVDFSEQYHDTERILVLGDMLELGEDEAKLHRDLVQSIVESQPSKVYMVGPLMTNAWAILPDHLRGAHVMNPEQLIRFLSHEIAQHSAILLKASQGTGLGRVVEAWAG